MTSVPRASHRPVTITLLSPVLGGFYFGGVVAGAARAATAGRHAVVAVQTLPAGLERVGELHTAPPFSLPVDGAESAGHVVVTSAVDDGHLDRLVAGGAPVVLVSRDPAGTGLPVVLPDNAGGVRAAVAHLVSHGHTRIGFVGHLWLTDARERHAGYLSALREHGIEPDPRWRYEAPDNLESGGVEAAGRMLADGLPTTAVVAATDRNAAGLMATLQEAGVELPAGQAVVGFDNADLGARLTPPLTTVDQHPGRLGGLAVRVLLARLRGRPLEGRVLRTPTSLVRRESCGCPPPGPQLPSEAAVRQRTGELETAITTQYEVELELLGRAGADPRRLRWVPLSRVDGACLGLWAGEPDAAGERPLTVAGARDGAGRLTSLVGTRRAVSRFPPAPLVRLAAGRPGHAVLVVPVSNEGGDWGMLAVAGPVDTRSTSAREVVNQWGALLAAALEAEQMVRSLRRQRGELTEAYEREKALVRELRASEERYALAAGSASDGLWDWDVAAGRVYFSAPWAAMLGHAEGEIGSTVSEWLGRVHPADRAAVAAAVAAQLGGSPLPLELEHRLRAADGGYRRIRVRARAVSDEAGTVTRIVGAMRDVGRATGPLPVDSGPGYPGPGADDPDDAAQGATGTSR